MKESRRLEKAAASKRNSSAAHGKSARSFTYPATADSVELPDFTFRRKWNEEGFILLPPAEQQSLFDKNTILSNRAKALEDRRLKTLLDLLWPEGPQFDLTVHIVARRAALLKIKETGEKIVVEVHWNLLIPYFYQLKELPLAHIEILDIFADAVFLYAALAMANPDAGKNELNSLVIDAYRATPELLLASLDILNKPGIYHIRPTKIWLNSISAANDKYRLQIDSSAAAVALPLRPDFLEEVAGFIHKVVKNYAFRYVDYLWTQPYRLAFSIEPDVDMVTWEEEIIVINVQPLIGRAHWKPALYLSLGYAVMIAILQSAGGDNKKDNTYLAMMKTWNRYFSFDESDEQQSVQGLCGLLEYPEHRQSRLLLERVTGRDSLELIDDFIMFMDYSAKETFAERLKVLNEFRDKGITGVYYEQLWNTVRNLNATLMKNNINYSKLIEVLRNDNIDHRQLADLLRTGRLDNRSVVDVSEWLLLRTLLYDLINAPKVFKNDYKMLLKVLTKVNKSLIVYVWTLILEHDVRYERVNAYIAKLLMDIFVFDRVKIYEIVSDPVECLEAEAMTGYLLNWAGLSPEERRSISEGVLSRLPRNVITQLSVQTPGDVDLLIRVMTIRSSGLIGFYLHQAYRWGSTEDELTEKIRSYFPELLTIAQKAILPQKTVLGGAMLLLTLAQIMSDERDGFARNIEITEEDRKIVRGLIKQCVDWDQRHFVMLVGGVAAGYMGNIDGWMLQQFDVLLGRYGGGDRVVLRSVVQFDVENLIERSLLTAKVGEESALYHKIQLFRLGVDPVISDQANKLLGAMASRYGIASPEVVLKRRDIRAFILELFQRMKA